MKNNSYKLRITFIIGASLFFARNLSAFSEVDDKIDHFRRACYTKLQYVDGLGTPHVNHKQRDSIRLEIKTLENKYIQENIKKFNKKHEEESEFIKGIHAAAEHFCTCNYDKTCDDIHLIIRCKSNNLSSMFRHKMKTGCNYYLLYESYLQILKEYIEKYELDPNPEHNNNPRIKWYTKDEYMNKFEEKLLIIGSEFNFAQPPFIDSPLISHVIADNFDFSYDFETH